jgi:hypothetical protein
MRSESHDSGNGNQGRLLVPRLPTAGHVVREREMGFAAIDAARAAGVRHFVFSSVLHAILTDLTQHRIKRDLEEHLLSSGLEFTIARCAGRVIAPCRMRL